MSKEYIYVFALLKIHYHIGELILVKRWGGPESSSFFFADNIYRHVCYCESNESSACSESIVSSVSSESSESSESSS